MPVKLIVAAGNWESKEVKCTFTVQANEVTLVAKDRSKQIYELPAGTTQVRIVATPIPPSGTKKSPFWETIVALVVASNGTVTPRAGFAPWIVLTQATGATADATLAMVRVSRFREVTHRVLDLLKVVPGAGQPRQGDAPTLADLAATYGKWPPDDLDIHPLLGGYYLDGANPVKAGGILNFAKSPVHVDAESIVVELAGVEAPRLFGVVWPDAVARKNGAPPTPFFFYFRQTGEQDIKNVFVGGAVKGDYPYNLDYAERCLFEGQHYPATQGFRGTGRVLRAKGVPYQVTRSGTKAVMVFPVANAIDRIGYGVLSNFDEMGRLLADLQAFMFWNVGMAVPPSTVGKTALSAFSSGNGPLARFLTNNRASSFLKNNITAVYFLDPPGVKECVDAGLEWRRTMGKDKRVRLYSARIESGFHPHYRRLLGLKPSDSLPSPPYLLNAADNKITMALFPTASWDRVYKDLFGKDTKWGYWSAHHFVPATALTHALSQGDI